MWIAIISSSRLCLIRQAEPSGLSSTDFSLVSRLSLSLVAIEADWAVFECLLLTLSEIGIPKRLFEEYIPILGPAHGLGCLGCFQAL